VFVSVAITVASVESLLGGPAEASEHVGWASLDTAWVSGASVAELRGVSVVSARSRVSALNLFAFDFLALGNTAGVSGAAVSKLRGVSVVLAVATSGAFVLGASWLRLGALGNTAGVSVAAVSKLGSVLVVLAVLLSDASHLGAFDLLLGSLDTVIHILSALSTAAGNSLESASLEALKTLHAVFVSVAITVASVESLLGGPAVALELLDDLLGFLVRSPSSALQARRSECSAAHSLDWLSWGAHLDAARISWASVLE